MRVISNYGERPDEVVTGLYISSANVARNKALLQKLKITHVLTVAGINPVYPNDFTYKIVNVLDSSDTNLVPLFDECHKFIDQGLTSGGGVLVHCAAGISRSATVIISYLMKSRKMKFEQAYEFLKARRQIICPNRAFQLQLQEYEQILASEK